MIVVLISLAVFLPFQQVAHGDELDMEFQVSDSDLILLFGAFIAAIIGIFVFLARDAIMRKKTEYDSKTLESKKDRTYEKYHSDWTNEYEEVGKKKGYGREFARSSDLPDYYKILQVSRDATQEEIKQQYRILAKRTHPDRVGTTGKDAMAEINEAYEVLSDKETRTKYDRHLD